MISTGGRSVDGQRGPLLGETMAGGASMRQDALNRQPDGGAAGSMWRSPLGAAFAAPLLVPACGDDEGSAGRPAKAEAPSALTSATAGQLWIECTGSGEPTIILESGIHDASDYWTARDR